MRHADELSITVMPASANLGAHANDVLPPAENKAMAGFALIASCIDTTAYDFPFKVTGFPTDFSDATGINSLTGNRRSANTSNIFVPTKPVAPTTAIFIFLF
jgi:hypothetical protein